MPEAKLIHGDSLVELLKIPDQSVDAVCTDPPYPEINRDYGRLTEPQWHELMAGIIKQIRRVLKPTGSALFILQPNSDKIGRMRTWLWEFLAKYSKEWGMVQDIYWWNWTACPTTHCARHNGLFRPSVKFCCWFGPQDCYRNQDAILWESSFMNKYNDLEDRALKRYPSGSSMRRGRCIQASLDRGGSTPFNLFPIQAGSKKRKGSKHGASTPLELCNQLVKYLCPPSGTVLDPFSGVATFGEACLKNNRNYIGIEKYDEYHKEAVTWLGETQLKMQSII
jgi:DNA modification methylase